MERFLDPTNDLVFKRLFGTEKNKEILMSFLNDIFAGVHPKIEDVKFLPLQQLPETETFPQSFVDVSCRDAKGKQYIIEMQCYRDGPYVAQAYDVLERYKYILRKRWMNITAVT